jgi:hypothetical protein
MPVTIQPNPVFSLPTCVCQRCAWSWIPRSAFLPRKCPKCTSPNWNTPVGSVDLRRNMSGTNGKRKNGR